MGRKMFPKIAPSLKEIRDPTNTRFTGPTRVHIPSGTSIGSAVFVGLTVVTNRQTRRPRRYICNNRPYLCTACVRCGLTIITGLSSPIKLSSSVNRLKQSISVTSDSGSVRFYTNTTRNDLLSYDTAHIWCTKEKMRHNPVNRLGQKVCIHAYSVRRADLKTTDHESEILHF